MLCQDTHCKNYNHGSVLCPVYDSIVYSLNTSSASLIRHRGKVHNNIKPDWNDHVGGLHTVGREAFKLWTELRRSKQGPLFENKKLAHAKFKYAFGFIKGKENNMIADSLANKLQQLL